jgi:hypothetical protein
LFEGLYPETMPLKNKALLQRLLDEKHLLGSIVSALAGLDAAYDSLVIGD